MKDRNTKSFILIYHYTGIIKDLRKLEAYYSVKSVRIWSYSGRYFPAFGLNVER